MIVKNEEHVIERCLDSVRPLIDTWCIVDTGSDDSTVESVESALTDLPGEVHRRPWRDFGHNRTEALELARSRADFALILDADETIVVSSDFTWPDFRADAYLTPHRGVSSGSSFYRTQLVRLAIPWRYEGVLHEVIVSDQPHQKKRLDGWVCVGHFDGARSRLDQKTKYDNDAAILEDALKSDPGNARYAFYLAQSHRDAFNWDQAIAAYRRRATMGGWEEEVFYSLLQVGLLCLRQHRPTDAVTSFLEAHECRPTRREPLVELARHYRLQGAYNLAHLFAARAVEIPRPSDLLFLDDASYAYRAEDELSIAAFWLGHYEQAVLYADRVLACSQLPIEQRTRVSRNRELALERLAKSP